MLIAQSSSARNISLFFLIRILIITHNMNKPDFILMQSNICMVLFLTNLVAEYYSVDIMKQKPFREQPVTASRGQHWQILGI